MLRRLLLPLFYTCGGARPHSRQKLTVASSLLLLYYHHNKGWHFARPHSTSEVLYYANGFGKNLTSRKAILKQFDRLELKIKKNSNNNDDVKRSGNNKDSTTEKKETANPNNTFIEVNNNDCSTPNLQGKNAHHSKTLIIRTQESLQQNNLILLRENTKSNNQQDVAGHDPNSVILLQEDYEFGVDSVKPGLLHLSRGSGPQILEKALACGQLDTLSFQKENEMSQEEIRKRDSALFRFLFEKTWGLTLEGRQLRMTMLSLRQRGWLVYGHEYYLNPEKSGFGKGDLIFAKQHPDHGLCLLVVEVKHLQGSGSGGKGVKRRRLEAQVEFYSIWWAKNFSSIALVAGVGLTEVNHSIEDPHCVHFEENLQKMLAD